jgi:cytoskeletal protein CcmA (bactofilin family)
MNTERNIIASVVILVITLVMGLAAPAAADGVALGKAAGAAASGAASDAASAIQTIDHSVTASSGTSISIANTMRIEQTGSFTIPEDETYAYDVYMWTQSFNVKGTLDGDACVWAQWLTIDGTLTQDLNAFAQDVTINGIVGDDVRIFAQNVYIHGTIEGDAMIAAANLIVYEDAVIEGSLLVGAGQVTYRGTVKGDARIATGSLTMAGRIDGNAELFTDGGITLLDGAHVGGDLIYQAPTQIEFGSGVATGTITFKKQDSKDEVSAAVDFAGRFKSILHVFGLIAAIAAGSIIVALTSDHARKTANIVRKKPLKSVGIGFIAFICMPIIIILSIVFIITIPFGFVLTLAYLIALYIAKFYVAIWLGNAILRRGDAIMTKSPIPPMLLGLLGLYIITAIPVIGTLSGVIIIFFGLGALLQRKETGLATAFEPTPVANDIGLPSAFPGTGTEG